MTNSATGTASPPVATPSTAPERGADVPPARAPQSPLPARALGDLERALALHLRSPGRRRAGALAPPAPPRGATRSAGRAGPRRAGLRAGAGHPRRGPLPGRDRRPLPLGEPPLRGRRHRLQRRGVVPAGDRGAGAVGPPRAPAQVERAQRATWGGVGDGAPAPVADEPAWLESVGDAGGAAARRRGALAPAPVRLLRRRGLERQGVGQRALRRGARRGLHPLRPGHLALRAPRQRPPP